MVNPLRNLIETFLCSSDKNRKPRRKLREISKAKLGGQGEKLVSRLNSSISSKALLMAKMVSWKKGQVGEEEKKDDEAVWKKSIMMGERCRPLDFSGKIVYDSHGNLVLEDDTRVPMYV